VEHAVGILAVDGVDGCWIGPKDLSKSFGVDPAEPEDRQILETAVEDVLAACDSTRKIPGIYAGGEAKRRVEQGFLFVTICSDEWLLADGAERLLQTLSQRE
jgi:4-hydroxy-2-oxoheptanedioate aldolase